MATLNLTNVRAEIARLEPLAAVAWAEADKLRQGHIDAGTDVSPGSDAFAAIDEAFKAYDVLADNIAELKSGAGRLEQIDGYYSRGPAARTGLPLGDPRMGEIGQRLSGFGFSAGQRLLESPQYRALAEKGAFAGGDTAFMSIMSQGGLGSPVEILAREELAATLMALRFGQATTITGGGATSAGPFIQNDLIPGYVAYMRKKPTLAAVVGQGTTDSDVVEYVTQSAPTNNAAETGEDVAASESVYPYATNTTNVLEITHFVPITLRAMADAGQIRAIVENDLGTDVIDKLDTELASGAGGGTALPGIYNASGIGTFALGAYTHADAIHRALTTVRVAAGVLMEPDYIGMHPNDWQKYRLSKDEDGNYLAGPPNMPGPEVAWGIPAIISTVFTEGTPLIGNFGRGAMLWLREGLSVTSGLNGDDFKTRRVTLLAAMRVAFAVTRPGAFCTVTSF